MLWFETLFLKYSSYDFVVWRMVENNGNIIPNFTNPNLVFGNIGISFCYKNKFEGLMFPHNRDGEDFDFLMELKKRSKNFIITPEVYYKVRH